MKETWHAAQSGQTFDLVRYGYVNGAPFVVEIAAVSGDKQTLSGYTKYHLQANYHGDLVTTVEADTGNGGQRGWFDPWGAGEGNTPQYYRWNGKFGYMWFSDLGMYYAHGRWWRADIGIWLSPSEESGEYRYGSGQDAVNEAWDAISNFAAGATCQFVNDKALSATENLINLIQGLNNGTRIAFLTAR